MASASGNRSLTISKVIGDVVDVFVPGEINMTVTYPSRQVRNSCTLLPSAVTTQPDVRIAAAAAAAANTFYTLIMTDPDAPTPSDSSLGEYLHWMVTDIPVNGSAAMGRELMSYEAPQPMIGIHRFVFVAMKQAAIQTVASPEYRILFKTRDFAQENALGPPLAVVYFNAKKETGTGRR